MVWILNDSELSRLGEKLDDPKPFDYVPGFDGFYLQQNKAYRMFVRAFQGSGIQLRTLFHNSNDRSLGLEGIFAGRDLTDVVCTDIHVTLPEFDPSEPMYHPEEHFHLSPRGVTRGGRVLADDISDFDMMSEVLSYVAGRLDIRGHYESFLEYVAERATEVEQRRIRKVQLIKRHVENLGIPFPSRD